MFNTNKTVGLAVSEHGIVAVEIVTAAGRRTLSHAVLLPFDRDVSRDAPERLGKELKRALRQAGISASRCAIGLPTASIAAREKSLPVADAESMRGALSIAAEREFASGAQELSFDYSAWPSGKGSTALLTAAPRRAIDQLCAMAKAAGLSIAGITPSAVALATATAGPVPATGRLVLCLLPQGAELVAQGPQGVRLIRHLPVRVDASGNGVEALAGELRRIPPIASAELGDVSPGELALWDCVGAAAATPALAAAAKAIRLTLRPCGMEADLGLSAAGPDGRNRTFAQAAALACAAADSLTIDFLHSRLAPPKKARIGRRALAAAVAAVVLIAAGLYIVIDWRNDLAQAQALQDKLTGLRDSAQEANALVSGVTFARGWYDRRPEFLECLRQVTQAFPQEGKIWATSLVIREDMQVLLTGKSVNENAALDVLDRMKSDPRLVDVKPLYIRQTGGSSRDVSFAISLSLKGAR